MIKLKRSSCADTRTCDWSKVSKDQLLRESRQHIGDVLQGLNFFAVMLRGAGLDHDWTKVKRIDEFHADFVTGFERKDWWKMHQREERHHFNSPEFVRDDVNLLDVLEQIVDGVMAGLARSGEYRCEPVSSELLQKAYANTAKILIANVEVEPAGPAAGGKRHPSWG
jgi:hypothetical protein